MMTDEQRMEALLRGIRLRRTALTAILVSYLPLACLLAFMEIPIRVVALICTALVVCGIVLAVMLGASRCPSCGALFHVKGFGGHLFVRRCVHCNLSLTGAS